MKKINGFTLIELMIVVAILGIMATAALPNLIPQVVRAKMTEVEDVVEQLKPAVTGYYRSHGRFPADNAAAGIPPADKILSTHVAGVELVDGAFHVRTRGLGHSYDGVVTFRPQVVPDSPGSPVSWICGYRVAAEGTRAVGGNRTDMRPGGLPFRCR